MTYVNNILREEKRRTNTKFKLSELFEINGKYYLASEVEAILRERIQSIDPVDIQTV